MHTSVHGTWSCNLCGERFCTRGSSGPACGSQGLGQSRPISAFTATCGLCAHVRRWNLSSTIRGLCTSHSE